MPYWEKQRIARAGAMVTKNWFILRSILTKIDKPRSINFGAWLYFLMMLRMPKVNDHPKVHYKTF